MWGRKKEKCFAGHWVYGNLKKVRFSWCTFCSVSFHTGSMWLTDGKHVNAYYITILYGIGSNEWKKHSLYRWFAHRNNSVSCLMDVSIFVSAAAWELRADSWETDVTPFVFTFFSLLLTINIQASSEEVSLKSRESEQRTKPCIDIITTMTLICNQL